MLSTPLGPGRHRVPIPARGQTDPHVQGGPVNLFFFKVYQGRHGIQMVLMHLEADGLTDLIANEVMQLKRFLSYVLSSS